MPRAAQGGGAAWSRRGRRVSSFAEPVGPRNRGVKGGLSSSGGERASQEEARAHSVNARAGQPTAYRGVRTGTAMHATVFIAVDQ
jgi:hypothetical protein